jgi:DNA-nicking Smr family endonuclease
MLKEKGGDFGEEEEMQKKKVMDNTPSKSSLTHNPLGSLKDLVDRKKLPPSKPAQRAPKRREEKISSDPHKDEQLFHEAMEGVNPIARDKVAEKRVEIRPPERSINIPETEALSMLVRLVNHGEGFVVSDTPEYIEGTGCNVPREFAQRLHRGDFSIQAHIDLHGFNVEEAREAFEAFLKEAVNSGKRAVLIIHGRGLSSPAEPVLKNKVREWLTRGNWRKWLIAYTSAQSYDGGAGATYVLLRHRPLSKRLREK